MKETQLVKYNAARLALKEAHRIDEVKDIRDRAEALRAYAVQAKDVDMQNWAAEIRVRAERRAGELLAEMPKQHGSRGVGKRVESPKATPLSKLGITKTQSSKWQKLAQPDEAKFEKAVRNIMGTSKELTTAGILRDLQPPKQRVETDCLTELQKRLSPLMPIGADGQPKVAALLDGAVALANGSENQEELRCIVAMLKEISKHFAAYAKTLEGSFQVARVA